jgi:hypothetical protein
MRSSKALLRLLGLFLAVYLLLSFLGASTEGLLEAMARVASAT